MKNIPFNVKETDFQELFSRFGVVNRVLLPPTKAVCIVEFDKEGHAENAFKNLHMYEFKQEPLFMEWAPLNFLEKRVRTEEEK